MKTDIVERLRRFKTGCDKPECERMIFTPLVCEEAAAEIARLRAGGCARDQGTTQYCAEAAKLAAENERLRAALEDILSYVPHGDLPLNLYDKARAALEGRDD